ncbi:50S ribosomal protein L28, partial [Leptospira borgpetersenii serovar Ballum]|nr:50S ribosomal protein L28 [Leptospira borgpetersenii serovar Ballum]
ILRSLRLCVESDKSFCTLLGSANGMRVIDKKGIDVVLSELRARGEKY